jgi:glycerophosphoryl diester phosphodiesterase
MQHGDGAVAVQRRAGAGALVVAHRGVWGEAPQNSLAAFEAAVALGCDGIELDVRRTADHQLVVVHDARVNGRPVGGFERDRLQTRMKLGQAPLLDDALRLAAGRIAVDLELKEAGYVEQTMAIVTTWLAPDQYVVTSFRDDILATVKGNVPAARTGLLVGPRPRTRELERRVRRVGVDFLAPNVGLVRRGILTWTAERELPAWLWTVNDARALRALHRDRRVAALITDRAQRALDASPGVDTADSRE